MSIVRPVVSPVVRPIVSAITAARRVGGAAAPAFDPASLFGVGDVGSVGDMQDASTMFQTSAATGAVVLNSPIGYVTDISGNGNHIIQATSNARPTWSGFPTSVGADIAVNGDFDTDTDWTKGTGWAISGGSATKTAGTASVLSQSISVTAGVSYLVQVNMTRTAGTLAWRFTGGTTVSGVTYNYSGSYYEILAAQTGNVTFELSADSAFAGTVRLVEINEVLTMGDMGATFDRVNDSLRRTGIDASGSNSATFILAFNRRKDAANTSIGQFGGTPSQVRTVTADMVTHPRSIFSDGSVSANVSNTGENKYYNGIFSVVVDSDGATVLEQISLRLRGFLPSNTPTATPTSAGPMAAAGALSIGTTNNNNQWWGGQITRYIFINRALTGSELINAENWVRAGMTYGAVLGDSTVADRGPVNLAPRAYPISSLCPGLICGPADVSASGDRIANQKTLWSSVTGKAALECVFLQIGLNDVKGRVGEGTATTAEVIADLQDLVDTVRADVPDSCKIYVSGLNPCKQWLDTASNPADAYQAWLDVNAAIAGTHSTNITGVDGRITSHVAALNDGSGNLAAKFNYYDDGVHEGTNARFIIAQAWRAQLEADNLV